MNLLGEFAAFAVHLSFGISILIGLTASEFSGAVTIAALPITFLTISLSAFCGASLNVNDTAYKKRKLCDILEFFKIWFEILELLAVSATCARTASATIDYITHQKVREWFLGMESHSLGEPWPDIIGVSIVIALTLLYMLGLEKSPLFRILLLFTITGTIIFFISTGSLEIIINISRWFEDFKLCSLQFIISAAAMCSYGFTNTFPKFDKHRAIKITTIIILPMVVYTACTIIFTLMCHYKELHGTATPLLRVFELRDVDWARLVMSIFIITLVCLALTEVLPSLYSLFEILSSKEWQVFLNSMQYRNSFTGAPLLAIFASGSLTAILAFACPLEYLIKIVNASMLLKCMFRCLLVLHFIYKPETKNEAYFTSSSSTQYSKLSSKGQKSTPSNLKNKVSGIISGWRRKNVVASDVKVTKKNNSYDLNTEEDDEYLLLNEYCDKSADIVVNDDSSDGEEKECVESSGEESSSYTSTDIDVVVQEYKDKVHVATIDNFNENKYPTHVTATTVIVFVTIIAIAAMCLSQVIYWKLYNLLWPCLTVLIFSTLIILVMPKNEVESQLLPSSMIPLCNILAVQLHIIFVGSLMSDVWLGFIFWSTMGCFFFWRCECCTCDGLLNYNQKPNITENISQYPDSYVDTILIAR